MSKSGSGADKMSANERLWLALAIVLVGIFFYFAFQSVEIDHAFEIITNSRALYTDEGWYLKLARNINIYGFENIEYDFQHWPAAPVYNLVVTGVFGVFGVSMEIARIWSVIATVGALLSFFMACRKSLSSEASFFALTLVASTFLVFHFSRTALADPTATFFSMLAVLAYIRWPSSLTGMGISLLLSAVAAMTKSYYIIVLFVMIFNYSCRIILIPWFVRDKIETSIVIAFAIYISTMVLLYLSYYIIWSDDIALWTRVTLEAQISDAGYHEDRISQIYRLISRLAVMLAGMLDLKIMILSVFGGIVVLFGREIYGRVGRRGNQVTLHWSDIFFLSWAIVGIIVMCVVQHQRSHYFFSLIFPLAYLAVTVWERALSHKFSVVAVSLVMFGHLYVQAPNYWAWYARKPDRMLDTAYREIAKVVVEKSDSLSERSPLIGLVSSSIALYEPRIIPLEPIWTPRDYSVCDRIRYWRPGYYVLLRGEHTTLMGYNNVQECEVVSGMNEVGAWSVYPPREEYLVLYELLIEE